MIQFKFKSYVIVAHVVVVILAYFVVVVVVIGMSPIKLNQAVVNLSFDVFVYFVDILQLLNFISKLNFFCLNEFEVGEFLFQVKDSIPFNIEKNIFGDQCLTWIFVETVHLTRTSKVLFRS